MSYRGLLAHRDRHAWSQRRLSHYLEDDLSARARRRLERHAAECPDCSRGIQALKALLRLLPGLDEGREGQPPAEPFNRVHAETSPPANSDPRAKP